MKKCPACLREVSESKKKWKFGQYNVEAFSCECGTDFRSYKKDGIDNFKLKKDKTDGK
ncbi:MAG: hypothetical protein P8X91_08725 [Candidatus Bathyarchaeota archaeon]